ncbi:zinc ribbon domain-containing protein [Halostagnicola sp. A-GB9-2]|uniref:zinc ribbon domain-containing protein n=1 Tax=Halostagnicola sp. A-GB9-2 TaxID=3048066 RepID=UPI0024C09EC2|nr:zinc ribbon domain-containing protein [Halostagnicola sp. A-GB9-2]MDJ1431230.1 zinc ribbon domain-containing protein [Halostagnicola sp. A-GB9-2]
MFESLEGIRNDMDYGSYMNRRLHKLPFYEFERPVTYKTHRHRTPVQHVESEYNSQRCACCGDKGIRNRGWFTCQNDACDLAQDHSDRNASVNAAVRWIAKMEGGDDSHSSADNYRPRKTPPQLRVRRVGSGRHNTTSCGAVDINRPTSSRSIAEQGVLHN